MFWNETAFPLCSATDSCWNRKVDSLASPIMLAVLLPIFCTSSTAWWFHVPPVSMATGTNTRVLDSWLYLMFLLVAAWLAADTASLAVLMTWESAYVSGTVTSQACLSTKGEWWCHRDAFHLAASDQLVLWLRESVHASWLADRVGIGQQNGYQFYCYMSTRHYWR